ncbi:MAG: hypothetical protein KJ574_02875 [Nanoarchaeota archaeon]|nr:hypothetical protein [Nanoarchaeota archaeon]
MDEPIPQLAVRNKDGILAFLDNIRDRHPDVYDALAGKWILTQVFQYTTLRNVCPFFAIGFANNYSFVMPTHLGTEITIGQLNLGDRRPGDLLKTIREEFELQGLTRR